MKLINDDFRVVETYVRKKKEESYLVERIGDPGNLYFLKILEPHKHSACISDFIKDFPHYSDIKHRYLLNSYQFGIVKSLNLKPISGSLYFAISEYSNWPTLKSLWDTLNLKEAVKIISELIEVIDYLHFRGIAYKLISPEKIYVGNEGDIKLLNLSTALEYMNEVDRLNIIKEYIAPEVLTRNENVNIKADYYSIGILIEKLILPLAFKEKSQSVNLLETMVQDFTRRSQENRLGNLMSCKESLEKEFGFTLGTDYKKEREELHFETVVVGHEDQLKELEEIEELIKSNNSIYSCASIEGSIGSGKSYLMDSFFRKTKLRGSNTSIITITGGKVIGSDSFRSFLLDFMDEVGIIYRLEGLNAVLRIEHEGSETEYFLDIPGNLYRLYDYIADTLRNKARQESIFIGINNIEYADPQMLGMLDFLLTKFKNCRIFIIVTLNLESIESMNFEAQLEEWMSRNNVLRIRCSNLSLEATGRFVKEALGMSFIPRNFSQIIYKESLGNIRYIIYLLRHFLETKEMYISDDGLWKIRRDRYDDLEFPKTFMDTIIPRIETLDIRQLEFLKIISCFEGPARESILKTVSGLNHSEIDSLIDDLTKERLITKQNLETGPAIDIAVGEIKKTIYQSIDEIERVNLHKRIASEIIKPRNESSDYSFDELFYQLNLSNQFDDLISLVYQRIDRERNKFSDSTMLILKKAYEAFSSKSHPMEMPVLDRINYSYIMRGDSKQLDSYLNIMLELSHERNEERFYIRALLYRLELLVRANELVDAQELIKDIGSKLLYTEYYEEQIYYKLLVAKYQLDIDDHNAVGNTADEGILISKQSGIKRFLGDLYNIRGISKYMNGDPKAALEDYNIALEGYENSDRPFDMVKPINNIGSIQSEYYGSEKIALDHYYRCVEISENYGLTSLQTTFLNNIGEAYSNIREYDNAEKYLDQAIELSRRINDRKNLFMSYVLQGTVYLRKGRFGDAYRTREILEDMNSNGPILDREILIQYTNFLGQLFLEIGDFNLSRKYTSITIERSFDISKKEYMKAKTRLINLDFIDDNTTDEKKIFDLVKEYREQGSLYDRAYFLLMYSLIAYYQGYIDQSQKLRDEFDSITNSEVREKYKNDLNLVNLIVDDTKESLMEALKLSVEHQENIIISKYHINTILGSRLLKRGMIVEAVRVLLENLNRFETVARAIGYDKLGNRHKDYYMLDLVIPLIDKGFMEVTETVRDFEPQIDNYLAHMNEKSYHQIFGESKAPGCCISVDQLLSKLDENAGENLDKILQFIAVKTNAEIGYIEIYGRDAAGSKIYKYNTENVFTLNLIVENTIKEGEAIVIKRDLSSNACHMLDAHVDPELAGFMAVPIMIGQGLGDSNLERRQSITRNRVYGHILLLTRSNINRFDETRLSLAKDLTGLVYLNSENERLFRNSYYDRLTGTLRRSIVERNLEDAIQHYSVNEKGFACMMLDIDRFKSVNDNYGHQAGDRVLSMIGDAIRNSIRRTDTAGRYGGEEFLLIIEDVDRSGAAAVAEKIRNTIENMKVKGIKQKVTASIGISIYPDDGQMPEDLILRADQAMYYAKEVMGRNSITVWKDGMEAIISSNKLDHDLLISGFASDVDRIGAMADAALLIGKKLPIEQKLNEFLGLIMDSTLGQIAEIYKYENGEFVRLASRSKNAKSVNASIPVELFKRVENTGLSEHYIDWKFKQDLNEIGKSREFRSGAVCPIIRAGTIFGLIFVESSLETMEFKQKELKYIEVMGSVFCANLV